MSVWAEYALGNLGRTGDYCNSAVMAMAGAAEWFGQDDPAYGENVRRYYEHVRENDLLLTHTLVLPQANRSLGPSKQKHQTLAARIVDRNDNGIVIRGARILATIGPFADEILVMPSTVLKGTPRTTRRTPTRSRCRATRRACASCAARASTSAAATSTTRSGRASRRSTRSSMFDDVLVPYERCFIVGQPELCNGIYTETSAAAHMTHQVVDADEARRPSSSSASCRCSPRRSAIEQFQHVQEKTAEVIVALETCKALLRAAEADAEPNRFGVVHARLGRRSTPAGTGTRGRTRASRRSCVSSAPAA